MMRSPPACFLLWATFGFGQEPGGPADEFAWHDGFADTQAWTAQPSGSGTSPFNHRRNGVRMAVSVLPAMM
jgi:hypothetical protein